MAHSPSLLVSAFANDGVHFLNISNPKIVSKIGSLQLTSGKARYLDLIPEKSLAVVALGPAGVGLIDYSDPTNPTMLGALPVNSRKQNLSRNLLLYR